jgi:hypothetical protein
MAKPPVDAGAHTLSGFGIGVQGGGAYARPAAGADDAPRGRPPSPRARPPSPRGGLISRYAERRPARRTPCAQGLGSA